MSPPATTKHATPQAHRRQPEAPEFSSRLATERRTLQEVQEALDAIPTDSVTARTAGALRVTDPRRTIAEERAVFEQAVGDENARQLEGKVATLPFLDTNVFPRHLLQDHPNHSPRSTLYFDRIERGELRVEMTATVVFETVFTLQSFYKHARPPIRDNVLHLLRLPGIALPGKRRFSRAFDLYTSTNLSFAACLHVAIAEARKVPQFVSFDRGLDRIPGLNRVEP